ncbi:MAG: NAD(P)H-dependent oxidoreductase [Thaumarchaeota archaeon]|nr:NAD(P)H-dependent oxidoreductase [Nitrososphaerota archaeon]
MKVVVISGSPRKGGLTQIPMRYVYDYVRGQEPDTSFINLADGNIECYRGYGMEYNDATTEAARLITEADVWLVGTPIYNSFFSGALKNLFEYINYKATAGKVAGMAILASGNIGFTDVQTLLTQLLSYFRVIANPKAVYMTVDEIADQAPGEQAAERLREMVDGTLQMARRLRK